MAQNEPNADTTGARGGAVTTFTTWTGAAMSAALLGGLVVWGWQLTVRDVAGVPVIRAIEGPMRTAPESAGGAQAAYQGLDVNRVAENAIPDLPDQIVLAPGVPELSAEDLAPALADDDSRAEPEIAAAEPREAGGSGRSFAGTDLAVAEALGISPESMVVRASLQVPSGASGAEDVAARPAPRPATRRAAIAPDASTLSASELSPGARLVQLGAFGSADEAHAAWGRIATEFDSYLTGKQRVIQRAESGGEPVWRLRAAGFDDMADARRFCTALRARDAECVPTVVR